MAVIIAQFLFSATKGLGLYEALNLFSFRCFERAVAPNLMKLSLPPQLLSAQISLALSSQHHIHHHFLFVF